MAVYVLDRRGQPLMPCSEKRARLLLERGRARVHRHTPFVIRLVDRRTEDSALQALALKLDPGSRVTGLALVRMAEAVQPDTGEVVREGAVLSLIELVHRGRQITEALTQRRGRAGHLAPVLPTTPTRRRLRLSARPPSLRLFTAAFPPPAKAEGYPRGITMIVIEKLAAAVHAALLWLMPLEDE